LVSEKEQDEKRIYICDLCGFGYKVRKTAENCEKWCASHQSCNIEITMKAVYIPGTNDSVKTD